MGRFDDCLKFVLQAEGGLTDDPADPGGRTNKGIEQREYNAWRTAHKLPQQDVAAISDEESATIYRTQYWDVCHCGELPQPLDLAVFDCGVNQGNGRAMAFLCRIWGLSPMAHWTPGMTMHVKSITAPKVDCAAFIAQRLANYLSLVQRRPVLGKFIRGWENRLHALKVACGLIAG